MKTAVDSAKAKFIGLFVTSLVMCVVVTAAFWGPLPRIGDDGGDSLVPERASNESSPTFSGTVLPDDSGAAALPAGDRQAAAEKELASSVDSLRKGSPAARNEQVNTTLALFREALKDPRSTALISDALHNRNRPQANAGETDKLKDSILVKEGQIVSLQNEIRTLQKNPASAQPDVTAMKKNLADKDAQIAKLNAQLKGRPAATGSGNLTEENKKLADENNFLKWAVRSEVNSNHNLTNLNATLKQANANLQNQLNELKKK